MTLAATIERSRRDKEDWKYTNLDTLLPSSSYRRRPVSSVSDSEHIRQMETPLDDKTDNRAQLVFVLLECVHAALPFMPRTAASSMSTSARNRVSDAS